MVLVNEVLEFLWSLAPEQMKEDWDHVGLMVGYRNRPVRKILVALDPFYSVCQEAAEAGADLLVTHHPLFFGGTKSVCDETADGRSTMYLIERKIACIAMHTNLDAAPGGVNDCLARQLGLQDAAVLAPAGQTPDGRPYGLGRVGTIATCSLQDFLSAVKEKLGCEGLRYCDGGREVSKVAVGGGACAGFLSAAAGLGCDTFVTSDCRYNQFQDAKELGVNLIDAGHFWTENVVCRYLAQQLAAQFAEIPVVLSTKHTDVTKFAG